MDNPEVQISNGILKGAVLKNIDGLPFYSFKGIPYAKKPIGDLRFKDPVPAEPWEGTRDALDFGPVAAQLDLNNRYIRKNSIVGSDDCLYLNVYTKSLGKTEKSPVMVWIHGGDFIFGSGNDDWYGPDLLMKKDVVLVTINYRLGVLGFLDLEDEVASGNQGLKDQVMALKWVRDNIMHFGGDSNNVTIFGESAGGASVHYLTMSPLAKGLFHKAISQSGVAVNPWASLYGNPRQFAINLCKLLGKAVTDPHEILEFLRTIDPIKLVQVQEQMSIDQAHQLRCPFAPTMDSKSPNPFMPKPLNLAAEQGAHVPYLLGHTDREAVTIIESLKAMMDFDKIDANFESFLHPNFINTLKTYNLTADELRRLYLRSEKITKNSVKMMDLYSDMQFAFGIQNVVKNQVQRNSASTYMYIFTYDQGFSLSKSLFKSDIPGAAHMDELYYLFGIKSTDAIKVEPLKIGSKRYKLMEQMIEMWTNFAKTGKPTLERNTLLPINWLPVTDGTVLRYLNIGEDLRMEKILNVEEFLSFKKEQDAA